MQKCQWSNELGLCEVFRVKDTDTKVSCDGLKDRKCSGNWGVEDVRDRPQNPSNNNERSEPVHQAISMSLAKKATITAKLDLSNGSTDYELKLTISAKPEDILNLIHLLQSDAPVMLDFTSPQMELAEVGSHES